jgi:hypothetical protein
VVLRNQLVHWGRDVLDSSVRVLHRHDGRLPACPDDLL